MKASAHADSGKRKRGGGPVKSTGQSRKRLKVQDARTIAVQTTEQAFRNGELDVQKYVKAREFEIQALEQSLARAKKGLNTRAFQELPRELRRRTASHNVKRIPKRLRKRAGKEMKADNTPIVTARRRKPTPRMRLRLETAKQLQRLGAGKRKDCAEGQDEKAGTAIKIDATTVKRKQSKETGLQQPPQPSARFRKRQVHKTWLPTHLFHTKRAHMTAPTQPLWRFAIPLTPTDKCYRATHRSSHLRGAIAWDTSYYSTVSLYGDTRSIIGLLIGLGIGPELHDGGRLNARGCRWQLGRRVWSGWAFERNGWPGKAIAPVTVFWKALVPATENEASKKVAKRTVFIRVHPSAFLQLWTELSRLAKVQKPAVLVEDLRFEIGSIELVGPAAAAALVASLRPSQADGLSPVSDSTEDVWDSIKHVSNAACLPDDCVLALDVSDPRLTFPHQRTDRHPTDAQGKRLLDILCQWPVDHDHKARPSIFDRSARLAASRQLPSQKSINRRRRIAEPGQPPKSIATDPRIPILVFVARGDPTAAATLPVWTVLLPWKCVSPAWNALLYSYQSAEARVRFGGINERMQLDFESGLANFPADYPGTAGGMAWEVLQREKRVMEWRRRPPGRKTEYEKVKLGQGRVGELGAGTACDWHRLLDPPDRDAGERAANAEAFIQALALEPGALHQFDRRMLASIQSNQQPAVGNGDIDMSRALVTVQVQLLGRGAPEPCARIYRLPGDVELKASWLALVDRRKSTIIRSWKNSSALYGLSTEELLTSKNTARLAASLLRPPEASDADYPEVPPESDLIGFVTSGNFNLREGRGSAVGCVLVQKVLAQKVLAGDQPQVSVSCDMKDAPRRLLVGSKQSRLCIVRNAGQSVGRLARWHVV